MRCVACNETEPECTENAEDAKLVDCQMENPDGPNYGNFCLVGHTGKLLQTPIFRTVVSISFFTIVLRKVRTLFFRNFHIPVENGTEIKYRRSCIYRSVKNMGCYQKDEYLNGKPMIVDECICDTTECNRKMGVIETSSKSSETTTKGNNKK